MNTIIKNNEAFEKALSLCKGCYQEGIIRGYYRFSGTDLKGKARKYVSRYARSRRNLLNRLNEHKVKYRILVGKHNKLILQIGEWYEYPVW